MEKKRILYIGGFEMPDGNAAAQRVLAVARTLQEEFDFSFVGITHNHNYTGRIDAFQYYNFTYPQNRKEWWQYLNGRNELEIIRKEKPDLVMAYNFPALGLFRMIRYCRKKGIKLIGDITEWYHPHNLLKWIDTEWRMVFLNRKMDGLIVISRFLQDYYKGHSMFLMPPTVDSEDNKWNAKRKDREFDSIKLMYAGSPGRGDKDRLDGLVEAIGRYDNLVLDIVGVTQESFRSLFPEVLLPENVRLWGRQPHSKTVSMLCESDFSVFFRPPTRVNNAGFPTKFVEAQTAGVPVITNHFSDLEEYVENGKNGFLANGITKEEIDIVLSQVAHLSKREIEEMHSYTRSLNFFDYRKFKTPLMDYMKQF